MADNHTNVTIDMPFGSMFRFMLKWSLAAIPAALVVWLSVSLCAAALVRFWNLDFGAIAL